MPLSDDPSSFDDTRGQIPLSGASSETAASAPTLRERYYDKSTREIAALIKTEFLDTGLVKLQSDQRGKPVPRGSVTSLRAYAEVLAIQRTAARHEKLIDAEAAKRGPRRPQPVPSDRTIPVVVSSPSIMSAAAPQAREEASSQPFEVDNRWAPSQPSTAADDDVTAFERLLILDEYDVTDATSLPARLTLFHQALKGTDDQMEIEMLIGQLFRQRLLIGPRESDPLTGMHIPSAARPVAPGVQDWYEEAYAKYVHASEFDDESDDFEEDAPESDDTPRQSGWLRGRFRRRP